MKRVLLFALPLIVLAGLLGVFAVRLNHDPGYIPSVLINKPAPDFALPPVAGAGVPGFGEPPPDGLDANIEAIRLAASDLAFAAVAAVTAVLCLLSAITAWLSIPGAFWPWSVRDQGPQ